MFLQGFFSIPYECSWSITDIKNHEEQGLLVLITVSAACKKKNVQRAALGTDCPRACMAEGGGEK